MRGPMLRPTLAPSLAPVPAARQRDPRPVIIFAVVGELDLATAGDLERELTVDWTAHAKELVLDLAQLEFVDCAGLHALERIWAHHRSHGTPLRLTRVPPQALRLLLLTDRAAKFDVSPAAGGNAAAARFQLTARRARMSQTSAGISPLGSKNRRPGVRADRLSSAP